MFKKLAEASKFIVSIGLDALSYTHVLLIIYVWDFMKICGIF